MEIGEYECDSYLPCMKYKVYSRNGCDSLYVRSTLHDKAGNNVGYSNDMTAGVAAGQTALMTLPITDKSADGIKLDEISAIE